MTTPNPNLAAPTSQPPPTPFNSRIALAATPINPNADYSMAQVLA